jgi:hypothetical protein
LEKILADLMDEQSASCPNHLTSMEGGWVGPTASMDAAEKIKCSYLYQESNPNS